MEDARLQDLFGTEHAQDFPYYPDMFRFHENRVLLIYRMSVSKYQLISDLGTLQQVSRSDHHLLKDIDVAINDNASSSGYDFYNRRLEG